MLEISKMSSVIKGKDDGVLDQGRNSKVMRSDQFLDLFLRESKD